MAATEPLVAKLREELEKRDFGFAGAASSGLLRGDQSVYAFAGFQCSVMPLPSLYEPQQASFGKPFCALYERISALEFGEGTDIPATYFEKQEQGETDAHSIEIGMAIETALRHNARLNVIIGHSPDLEIGLYAFGGNDKRLLRPLGAGEGYLFELNDETFEIIGFEFIALHPPSV